mmetsp:Transcript_26720/g.50427  ORF Transcript_26720/g.50427 Transcript_26720/m.50427 type:complete len:118 (-) Transcript_26720:17-370(-)
MNRFFVKESCILLFEERWAERNSKLPEQPGFVSFSLLRNLHRQSSDIATESLSLDHYNYASCTIWASHEHWLGWRNGAGRYSHSHDKTRTPVSTWMHRKATPVFWDGIDTIMSPTGV